MLIKLAFCVFFFSAVSYKGRNLLMAVSSVPSRKLTYNRTKKQLSSAPETRKPGRDSRG